jgi:multicomponent Na+:H+ antiporter subunit D
MQASLVPLIDWLVVVPVLLPLLGAALLLIGLGRVLPPTLWAIIVTAVVAIADMVLLHRVMVSGPLAMTMGRWLPPFGISFVADTLGAALALTRQTAPSSPCATRAFWRWCWFCSRAPVAPF